MKKIALFLFILFAVTVSCTKQVKQPLNYNVTNDALQNGVLDIYLPDSGTYDMAVLVKFLSGYIGDKVKLKLTGIPENVTVTPDTFVGAPTYTEHFIFTDLHAALGNHPLTLTASSPGLLDKVYTFNAIVLPYNSATLFSKIIHGSNSCASTDYMYDATGMQSADTLNILYISNFGGYGPDVTARVYLDPIKGTVSIPKQTVGNGSVLSGSGTFNLTSMTITYSAVSTPKNPGDYCTVVFTN